METENRIEEILNSANRKTKVVPDAVLFSKIMHRIDSHKKIATPYIWLAAASFVILLSLNIKIVFSKDSHSGNSTESIAATISKTNQLY